MNEQLKELLTSFYQAIGYPEAASDPLSEYILGETVQTLLNLTNQKELPQGLSYVAVYWTTGAEAGCPVNKDLTNTVYGGSFTLNTDYTQAQLEEALKSGKFIFHRVGDEIRVLEDINTFVSATDEKSEDFGNNQVIRVLDQIGNDIAALFNGKYLGKVPNDDAGRISLWNDIVEHHRDLQDLRAIENFDPEDVAVAKGETKTSVVVTDQVTPVSAMRQLYMTVIVM